MFLSIFLKATSVFFLKQSISSNQNILKIFLATLLFGSLFLIFSYIFLQQIFGEDIAEAIVFHYVFGVKGAGLNEYILPIIIFIGSLYIGWILLKLFLNFISCDKNSYLRFFAGSLLLVLSIFTNPFIKDLYTFLNVSEESTDENLFYDQKISYTNDNKNLIFIYLEQFERTYLDQALFPELTPNLINLEKKSISFTDISVPKATNWTIGGMTASQCGVPLFTPIASGNSMSGIDEFMPLAKCAGDILKDAGYDMRYIGGSDLDFGGKGKFYKSHGFNDVYGFKELRPYLRDPRYRSPWGVHDDELLEIIFKKAEELHDQNEPFGIFALTLDTHHPNGYISKPCYEKKYLNGNNKILNSIHCVDMLMGAFTDKFVNSPLYENTILVIASDHLALKNTATNILEKGDRKSLFMILGKDLKPKKLYNAGSLFDIGPTMLGFLGTDTKGLGLGRNLFFEDSITPSKLEDVIDNNKGKVFDLWHFPQLNNNLSISSQEKIIRFGDRKIELPALILVNENADVTQIMFEFYYSLPLKRHVDRLDNDQSYIWVDKCIQMNNSQQKNDGYCVEFRNKRSGISQISNVVRRDYSWRYLQSFFQEKNNFLVE